MPTLYCNDCGNTARTTTECKASCCRNTLDNKLCSACWQRHFAQFFLDAHGIRDQAFGSVHDDVVSLMAKFRQF